MFLGPLKEDGNGFEHDQTFENGTAKNQEEYQAYLDDFHAKGNLTAYCHPEWSSTPVRYFEKLQGDFAMGIWNSGCVIIECSNVSMIRLHSDMHPTRFVRADENGMTRAEFVMGDRYPYKYVRVSIIDKDGKYAWTNPIFLED